MKPQLAYEEIVLEYGGTTLFLRPSLRAAIQLERLHDGFDKLFQRLSQFETRTLATAITATATDRAAAQALLLDARSEPLRPLQLATQTPVIAVCTEFLPAPAGDDENGRHPIPWADFYTKLFEIATGWLGWPPHTAWAATPKEILSAFNGLSDKLKAIHGAESDDEAAKTGPTEEQRSVNETAGLDPEFDREGLRALKAKIAGGYS